MVSVVWPITQSLRHHTPYPIGFTKCQFFEYLSYFFQYHKSLVWLSPCNKHQKTWRQVLKILKKNSICSNKQLRILIHFSKSCVRWNLHLCLSLGACGISHTSLFYHVHSSRCLLRPLQQLGCLCKSGYSYSDRHLQYKKLEKYFWV